MDSACGLLINLGEAIGEPLSTCSKLNKAYPEMALFSFNSASVPLSFFDPLWGIRANKMWNLDTLKIIIDVYHTDSKRNTVLWVISSDYSVKHVIIRMGSCKWKKKSERPVLFAL